MSGQTNPTSSIEQTFTRNQRILVEFAVAEQLRRLPGIELHPTLFNTPLVYGSVEEQAALASVYLKYLETANRAGLPILLTAPTWRLDARRVAEAEGIPALINTDAVDFVSNLVAESNTSGRTHVGALVGPKEDCYRPDLAPSAEEAAEFHAPQIEELAATDTVFLLAQTLPSVAEALGIARAMAESSKPYLISFCTGPDGNVLDGTPLPEAMARIDEASSSARPPLGYFVNCTYPSFLTDRYPAGSLKRLIGIQANGSAKDVCALEAADATEAEPVDIWAKEMVRLHATQGVLALGGCCGTSAEHMRAIVRLWDEAG